MKPVDVYTILINLANALVSLRKIFIGLLYITGLMLLAHALMVWKKHAESGRNSAQNPMIPLAYFIAAIMLLALPNIMDILSNSFFGNSNSAFGYGTGKSTTLYDAVPRIIEVAGIIWFARGCVLIAHSSEPGGKHGKKGVAFLAAGLLAIHFENSTMLVNHVIDFFLHLFGAGSQSSD